uniref:Uncharacterized protein n=1 Tax=Arundo donax TaxID=35708 RepID=A0A0A9GXR0_ARUDO
MCAPSSQVRLPKVYLPCTLSLAWNVTLNVNLLTVELKVRSEGLTVTSTPGGASKRALYFDMAGPTLVTVLDNVSLPLSSGIVMDGRFRSISDFGVC